jgi:D-glycerate 3-kinase
MPAAHQPAAGFAPEMLAARLDEALALPGRCPVYGIGGLPGTGKSTLAAQVAALARGRGIATTVLSLDDFYLGRRERRRLARRVHPLLAQRGPPGSHDVALALATVDALRAGAGVAVPRFDKLADTRLPPSRWRRPPPARLLILEGWFLGARPQPAAELDGPLNAREAGEDADGTWRRWCNDALAAYAPLWDRLDWLTWLQAPSFAACGDWRWQQEAQALAARPTRAGMDRHAIERFLQLFARIGGHALRTLPALADRCIALDDRRRPRG